MCIRDRQDKELNVGRGYVVKSGQASLIQVASPYDQEGSATLEQEEENDVKVARMLDLWIERIGDRFKGQRASWLQPVDAAGTRDSASDGVQDVHTVQLIDLLHRIAYSQAGDEQGAVARWDRNAVLFKFAREAFQDATKLDASMFGETQEEMTKEMLVAAETLLPKPGQPDGNGNQQ